MYLDGCCEYLSSWAIRGGSEFDGRDTIQGRLLVCEAIRHVCLDFSYENRRSGKCERGSLEGVVWCSNLKSESWAGGVVQVVQ
jgi:hypothetical protein